MGRREKPKRVTVTIKLKSSLGRFALAAAILLPGGFFISVVVSHFTIRAIADRRINPSLDALELAARRLPYSPRIQSRLAEAELIGAATKIERLVDAERHANQAVSLSSWDYRNWRLLALAQESNGKFDEAEKSMLLAVKSAPNHVEVNWMYANLLLRRGKIDESLKPFRVAASANRELLPIAFELLWRASDGDWSRLNSLADESPQTQLALANFLVEQSEMDAAIRVFRSVESKARVNSPDAVTFISSLLEDGQPEIARQLWLETMTALTGRQNTNNQIWNGSFEIDLFKDFNQFDWSIGLSDYARIGFDKEVAHGGNKSLRIAFAGRDTTKLLGEVRQLIVLKPNASYRLECYAKAANLVTPEGPRLAILSEQVVLATSDPVLSDLTDWQYLSIEFKAPANLTTASVSIVRIPRFSYDDPTKGIVWFDDFKLTER